MTAVMTTGAAEVSTVSRMERPASETRLVPTGGATGRPLSILPAGAAAEIPCSGEPHLMADGAKDILARRFAGRTLIAHCASVVRTTTDLSRERRRTIRF